MIKKIIFIFLVLLLAILAGFYLFFQKKTPNVPAVKKLVEIKVAEWKVYENNDFSFKYPADWTIQTKITKDEITNIKRELISGSVATQGAIILIDNGGITPPKASKPIDYKTIVNMRYNIPALYSLPTEFILGNKKVSKYIGVQAEKKINYATIPYDGGPGNYYHLSFDFYQDNIYDYPKLFDQIIASFVFVK